MQNDITPSASPLANSCRWCGRSLRAGADFHTTCRDEYLASPLHVRELERRDEAVNENAAWGRADAALDARENAFYLAGDDGLDPCDSLYEGSVGREVA